MPALKKSIEIRSWGSRKAGESCCAFPWEGTCVCGCPGSRWIAFIFLEINSTSQDMSKFVQAFVRFNAKKWLIWFCFTFKEISLQLVPCIYVGCSWNIGGIQTVCIWWVLFCTPLPLEGSGPLAESDTNAIDSTSWVRFCPFVHLSSVSGSVSISVAFELAKFCACHSSKHSHGNEMKFR